MKDMKDRIITKLNKQLSLDDILSFASLAKMSSSQLSKIIQTLQEKKENAEKREENARRLKEKQKAARLAREREKEERQRKHAQEVTCMDLPPDYNNPFLSDSRAEDVRAESISDGLILSLTNLGKVDIEYISFVTGSDCKTVISALKGSVYQNPDTWDECFYKGWETAEEYLSGNLMQKLNAAKKANQRYYGWFSDNIKALEKVLPHSASAEDIYITLGSPWVPADVIDDFIVHLFGNSLPPFVNEPVRSRLIEDMRTIHDEETGTWEIPQKNRYGYDIGVRETYGTGRIGALYILEKTLNMKPIVIKDAVSCPTNVSGKKSEINHAETIVALEKQKRMIEEFQRWVWTDESRKKRLENIFENKFGCVRRRIFDGSFLTFPNMASDVRLYPYQKDAVARILFTPNTLLAHDVGAGKTYVMIAAGQELRRMGLSRKNMYVVPNNITEQWRNIFLSMYPNANLLCVTPGTFTKKKRTEVLEKIRDNDYDGIIIAYSCFSMIPLSKKFYEEELRAQKKVISDLAQKKSITSRSYRKLEIIRQKLSDLMFDAEDSNAGIYFDDLGITRLFVDEAHNFKNVPIETQSGQTLGVQKSGSKKCQDMLYKVRIVQKRNNGGGVVFATGTPITNSVTDAYVMQLYLQSGELAMLGLQSFDGWIGMFAEKTTQFEIDVDTSKYRLATRFAKFHNLPELTSLLASVADFHAADSSSGIPAFDGYSDALIAKTDEFSAYLNEISVRADDVRSNLVSRREDNMLKITTDGRKAALDLRLVDPSTGFTYQSKIFRCAENVYDIYVKTRGSKGTQVVFCDISTPKDAFNLYDELKRLLIFQGIPSEQIAFVHDAKSEKEREKLFAKVRRGEIRILVGSTFKLGLGVNIQDKLIALHHLDVPWRPADMMQREGRILRQGNTNRKVYIYRYITEGSFDAYSWQLLETKQRFISALLSGSMTERSGSDIDDTVLNYAEVKALAIGNPLIKQRVEAANELSRFMTLQRKLLASRTELQKEQLALPGRITDQERAVSQCREDFSSYRKWKEANPPAVDSAGREKEIRQRAELRHNIYASVRDNVLKLKSRKLTTYRGFDVVIPAGMEKDKPYLLLERQGRYKVEMGNSENGVLIRIDNFLNGLEEYQKKLQGALEKLKTRAAEIDAELAKEESYSGQILFYKKRVEELDEKLGVNKQ